MYRKLTMFSLLLFVAFFLGSCIEKTDKYSNKDKEMVVDSVTVTTESLRSMSDELRELRIENKKLNQKVELQSVRIDSVFSEKYLLQEKNAKLKIQLVQARDEVIPAMQKQHESIFAKQQEIITNQAEEINCLESKYRFLYNDREYWRSTTYSLQETKSDLVKWAKKWKHDSELGFFHNNFGWLIGDGKAPAPDVPTPQLE